MLVVISGIFALGAFNFSFVLLKSQDFGISTDDIPLVYAVINVTHTIIGIPIGMFADKVGKEKVLTIGFSIFVITLLLMIVLESNQYLYAYVIAAVFGLYILYIIVFGLYYYLFILYIVGACYLLSLFAICSQGVGAERIRRYLGPSISSSGRQLYKLSNL